MTKIVETVVAKVVPERVEMTASGLYGLNGAAAPMKEHASPVFWPLMQKFVGCAAHALVAAHVLETANGLNGGHGIAAMVKVNAEPPV
jgi:hypothetical protein